MANSRDALFRMSDLASVRQRLRRFAEYEAAGASPLYAHLAAHAADDDEIASLLTEAQAAEAHPTLLFATAQRLLQADPIHPLTRYYPTLGGFDGVDSETWPLFRTFLLERADAARELICRRFTQTNEVGRAAVLYPAVALAAKQAGGKIALLEAGCSAGLLLGMDRFGYRYQCEGGEQFTAGPAKAAVGLHCAVDGSGFGKPPKKLDVGARIGLDRAPVDLGDEEELAWLEACIWADQPERVRLLRTAAAAQQRNPPELIAGDAVDDLFSAAARLPDELPLVVFTSHALVYLAEQRRAEFVSAVGELAASRPLWWVATGGYETELAHAMPGRDELAFARTSQCVLAVTRWTGGQPDTRLLAQTAPHGQRMTWL